jgi:hypothetical protein
MTSTPAAEIKRGSNREVELLLLTAQPPQTDINVERIRGLTGSQLNWDFLYQLARRHSLLPLLYQRLHSAYDLIPADALQRLRRAYQENVARNLIFADELVQLTRALTDAGIESIAYKGPVLAMLAYGDPALRRFVDLDVMVRRADVVRAAEVLVSRGYVAAQELTEKQQTVLLSSQHNLQFTKGNQRLLVELHWQVSSHLFAASVTAEELWNNLETVKLNGVELKTLSVDDLLFSLCVHGSRHLWERLAWIADVAHLLSARPEIDWQTLLKRAEVTHSERMFLLGVHLAVVLLAAPVPDQVRDKIDRDVRLAALAQDIVRRLFDGPEHRPATAAQIFEYNFRVRTSWRSRFRYMLFTFEPTERDVGLLKLPAGMGCAYYLVRPFRMFSKGHSKTSPGADA